MELEAYTMGEVDDRDQVNIFGSSMFGSEYHFNTQYTVDIEKYKEAINTLDKGKTYIDFENGVKSVEFSMTIHESYYSGYSLAFFAYSGTDNIETHYDCIQKDFDKFPTDEELLEMFKPILDSITGIEEDDLEESINRLKNEKAEIDRKIEILLDNKVNFKKS